MVFDRRPIALSQIEFFDWERLAGQQPAPSDTLPTPYWIVSNV